MGSKQFSRCEEKVPLYSFAPFRFTSHSKDAKPGTLWPKPRSGHRIATDGVNIYAFGGYNPQLNPVDEVEMADDPLWGEIKPLFKELWTFNIDRGSWKKLEVLNMPDTLVSNALVLSGNVLMVYGGTGAPFAVKNSNDLLVCNVKDVNTPLTFSKVLVSGELPPALYGQAAVLVGKHFYTVGGTDGYEFFCDTHSLDLTNNTWKAVYCCSGLPEEPWGRYRHEAAVHRDNIYIIGGGTGNAAYMFNKVMAFNLKNHTWASVNTLPDPKATEGYPAPRVWYSSAQMGNYVFIINGYCQTSALRDTWRLDLNTFQWVKILGMTLRTGLYFHSSCVTSSGKLYVFGGIYQRDDGGRISVERTADLYSSWVCIPKLTDICWEALLYYHPDKYFSSSNKELLSLGLPQRFVDKLFLES